MSTLRQCRNLQGRARDQAALVLLDRTKQRAEALGIDNRRHVLHQHGPQRTAEIGGRIALAAPSCHAVSKYLTAGLADAVNGLSDTASFDPPQGL
jgi:hypothetical protein